MTITMEQKAVENVIEIHLSGKIHRGDYEKYVPEIERILDQQGKIRVLVVMEDFHGWDTGGLWRDIKFDAKHYKDFERIALVGEKSWEKGMATICKPFTTADIRYFSPNDVEEARRWILQP
ncbi:MAG: STAS/SEC14 domain-containing protein [Phycisphaerae bacterium]|nr:STAS/SEC14 domain-containing protein [Phycisphaerae bacterium]